MATPAGIATSTLLRLQSSGVALTPPTVTVPCCEPRLTPSATTWPPTGWLSPSSLSRRGAILRSGALAAAPSPRVMTVEPVSVSPLRVKRTSVSVQDTTCWTTPPVLTAPEPEPKLKPVALNTVPADPDPGVIVLTIGSISTAGPLMAPKPGDVGRDGPGAGAGRDEDRDATVAP